MLRHFLSALLLTLALVWTAMSAGAITVTDTIFNHHEHEEFAFGADVSFVPQMESWGTKWLDKNGVQKDILQILKEQGINNIRLRVWTVANGASSKQEVVNMCKRAKIKGMGVMIDFHYSDTWADPGSQTIPSAWTDHSVEALAQHVYDHTYEVLSAIKEAGVVPKWVQVGNETKRGMLYPVGQTNKGGSAAFARFVQSGYDAVKAVDPSIQVIVHLPDGHDNSLYRSIFDGLKKNGAKWDIIGLSAYPRWSHLDGPTMITRVMSNINDLKSRYGTPCMVVETGHYPSEAVTGNQYLVGVMDRMIGNGDLGCFYWEPESMGGYDMGAWDEATRKPTVMMDAFLGVKHTQVSWLMKAVVSEPLQDQVAAPDLRLKADVKHVRNRIRSVDFYLDRRLAGTLNEAPYELPLKAEIGIHTLWVKATDTDGFTEMSDTVTFYVGESSLMDAPLVIDPSKKGGRIIWGVNVAEPGKYRLLLQYSAARAYSGELSIGGESVSRLNFPQKDHETLMCDAEIGKTGTMDITLTATGRIGGLPEAEWLRIFPLEGQALPSPVDPTGVNAVFAADSDDETVELYTLSGVFVRCTKRSQLGLSSLAGSPAVVVLPNSVGGTPYIVRKQRLK